MRWLARKERPILINELEIQIWERDFTLPVKYDCYQGEEVTPEQIKALDRFKKRRKMIEKSKAKVEAYCREKVLEDDENEKKDNVFSYVKPEYLFVKREEDPRVIMMCKYRYDLEHGLAVVFSSNGSIVAGSQDMIL